MVDASFSLRLLHKGDRSERLAPLAPVAGPLTRSLRPEGVGEDLRASSALEGTFALATSPSGALITRQRRNRNFTGLSSASSTPKDTRKE